MYFDPGFGGMLIQLIVAIVAVGGGLLYSFRKKIRNLFSGDSSKKDNYNAPVKKVTDESDDAIDILED